MDEKRTAAFHSLMLERQKGGTITGIREVISFDEKEILLHTEEGKLSIKGEGLHVKHLDLKSGQLSLEGKIDSLTYLGRKKDKKEGYFQTVQMYCQRTYPHKKRLLSKG